MKRPLAFTVAAVAFIVAIAMTTAALHVFWFVAPLSLIAGVVVARRTHPFLAGFLGAALTFGLIFGLIFPMIVINALQGNFDSGPYCDGFCFDNTGGAIFATWILLFVAVPTALAGGVISFIASLVTPRRSRAA